MRKKQQTTENKDSPDHIILQHIYSTSASREKHNKARRYIYYNE